jgi:hypothetical protein
MSDPASWHDDSAASCNVHEQIAQSNSSHKTATLDLWSGNGKRDVSIIASGPPAIGAAEPVAVVRSALVPAAVFILVEIMLVADTVSVILLKEIDPRKSGVAPIAILLSMALLANLGLVCSVVAASVAKSVRRSKWENVLALSDRVDAFEGVESAAEDVAEVMTGALLTNLRAAIPASG